MDMKANKIFYSVFVAGLMALTSCQNEELVSSQGENVALEIVTTTTYNTRTSLQEDGRTVVWNEGDAIAVYDYATPKRRFVAEIAEGTTRFKGNITPRYSEFIAAYPYDQAAENDMARKVVMYLPDEQTAVEDGFGPNLNLSVAKGERNVDGSPSQVSFRNVCQLFKLGIPAYISDRIAKIEFSATQAIAGELVVDYSDYDPVVAANAQGAQSIDLLPPTGSNAFAEGTYYIVIAPVEVEGFTITLTDTEGKVYTQHSNSNVGGTPGFIYNLGNMDLIEKPVVTSSHVYADGVLQGTKLNFTAPVPEKEWSAVVKNSQGATVRTLASAIGTLTSEHTDDAWPYLPGGDYTLEYTYTTANEKQMNASMPFQITEKPQFSLSMTANSTYSYYQAGNVDKANSMNAYAVDGISSTVNGISSNILGNSNYVTARTNSFEGTEQSYNVGLTAYNEISLSKLGSNELSTTFTFDGVTKTATTQVYITGLPFSHEPPTSNLWSANNGQTSFASDYVKTGDGGSTGSISFNGISVPASTKMQLAYNVSVKMDNALSTQRYTISVGNQAVFEYTTGSANTREFNESKVFTSNAQSNSITCYTGYCYGLSHSKTYKIALSYSN